MEIVERLRKGKSAGGYWREKEAADEIERLQEQAHYHYENGLKKDVEIERLREALQHMVRWHDQLSASDIAKAEAALQQNGSE